MARRMRLARLIRLRRLRFDAFRRGDYCQPLVGSNGDFIIRGLPVDQRTYADRQILLDRLLITRREYREEVSEQHGLLPGEEDVTRVVGLTIVAERVADLLQKMGKQTCLFALHSRNARAEIKRQLNALPRLQSLRQLHAEQRVVRTQAVIQLPPAGSNLLHLQ